MSTLLSLVADSGHDQLWLLLAAQRMGPNLNPYNALVFESNPPLAIWLSAMVVGVAHLLHLPLTVALKLAVTLLGAGSAAVCAKLVRFLNPRLSRNELWLLGIAYVLVFGAIPVRDFGQRDHILALLVLPYVIAAALDMAGRRLPLAPRIGVTLAAALGLALKPHQALIAVAVELTRRVAKRLPRILEPAIFLASALAYLAAIRHLAPTYLTQILPILRDTYWAFGRLSLLELLQASLGLQTLAVFTLSLRSRARSPLVLILLIAGIAADLAYLAQGTGWYYQQLPAISFLALALAASAAGSSKLEAYSSRITPFPLAALTLLAFALTIHFSGFHLTPRGIEQTQAVPDPSFFADLPPDTAVATLTTSVDDTVPPAFRYRLTLAQRYPHLWMLPAILRNESGPTPARRIPPERLAELDRLQHQFMVEDLERWRPALILVERCQDPTIHCQVLEDRHDDLLAWFLRDPAFALIFSKYRFLRTAGRYDAYALASH